MVKSSKSFLRLPAGLLLVGAVYFGFTAEKASAVTPPESTFFSTAYIEDAYTYNSPSDGDLWPSAWSNDNYLYTANGDGKGFSTGGPVVDIAVSKVTGGAPATKDMTGVTLSTSSAVGQVWGNSSTYNRKPTGMISVAGNLYVAIQDLSLDFNDAPNASISKSTDKGVTWTWDTSAPMFNNHVFTTIMFLDFGKDNEHAIDNYVYAYGLDWNWRGSTSGPDPTKLFLARVPKTSIQNRSTWEFYTGMSGSTPVWSSNISNKAPVLEDDTTRYNSVTPGQTNDTFMTVISQGSVVYNEPLDRYIYSSWSGFTFEFYEAPNPWGPWSRFLSKDYGPDNVWTTSRAGGYATVIPSKYISSDGKTLYVQSNHFSPGVGMGFANYNFATRKLVLEPYAASTATNTKNGNNLAMPQFGNGATRINKSFHVRDTGAMNDGNVAENEDSWDKEAKTSDWWGYTWKTRQNMNKVVYTTGNMFSDGGWFTDLKVQVRQNFVWTDVTGQNMDFYPMSNAAGTNATYEFTFNDISGDGVRIIGTPGGTQKFTSIAELAVYYADNTNLISDKGFESQTTNVISSPWSTDGTDTKGVDRSVAGTAHSGSNNGYLLNSGTGWNAVKQTITVAPNTKYRMTVWLQGSSNIASGFIGVSNGGGVVKDKSFGSLPGYTRMVLDFNSGSNSSLVAYAGYWGPGASSFLRIDDLSVVKAVDTGNLVQDAGFESQTTGTISSPWTFDGTDAKGIDRGVSGNSHSGNNNASLSHGGANWNAVKQTISVTPNKNYRLTVWLKGSSNITAGFVGVANSGGTVLKDQQFGSLPGYTKMTLDFNSGSNSTVTPYAGYWGPGSSAFLRIDDMSVTPMNWN